VSAQHLLLDIIGVVLAAFDKCDGCHLAVHRAAPAHAKAKVMGAMMNTRVLLELMVINIDFDRDVILQSVFSMHFPMVLASTIITTPLLKRRLPAAGLPAVHHPP
jgi:Kef-type K+ transport system membrane component KefB